MHSAARSPDGYMRLQERRLLQPLPYFLALAAAAGSSGGSCRSSLVWRETGKILQQASAVPGFRL